MQAVMETIFESLYLLFAIGSGLIILIKSKKRLAYILFGSAALLLGLGDSFHLVPRMIALCTTGTQDYVYILGIGKLVTSITMTIFYVLLFYFIAVRFSKKPKWFTHALIIGFAVIRIALCCFPQNEWTSADPSLLWGIIRNIPFVLLGFLVVYLCVRWTFKEPHFKWLFLAITLSFAFYIPVVLLAHKYALVGLLMLPKTMCYIWALCMGIMDFYVDTKRIEIEEKGPDAAKDL